VIISPGRAFIFVHIPKTGGTSMAQALEARAHRDDILIGDTEKALRRKNRVKKLAPQAAGRLWKHSTLADIRGVVSPDDMDRMLCFCLVRNPWDRMVSYYHWLQEQEFDHQAVSLAKTLDFGAFVTHTHTGGTMRAWPYARYMQDGSGTERGLFFRLEHLEEDWTPLVDRLGFSPEMPHINRSERGEYREYYTAELRDLIGDLCAEDVARFGYTF